MRLASLGGRLTILTGEGLVDVASLSKGRFGPDPQTAFADWPQFTAWAASTLGLTASKDSSGHDPSELVLPEADQAALGPPVPSPRQVFAVGLNYGERARAAGEEPASMPPVFPKFPTCLTGPRAQVAVPAEARLDFEVELVVAIGVYAYRVAVADAWSHVAGLMVGQDLSDREAQFRPPVAQFGLSKSRPGFGPLGPFLVTVDELRDPDDLSIRCYVNGELRQSDRTSNLLVSVSELIARLSDILPLLPGDLIFTGTPGGVGHYEKPPRYLVPGDSLVSEIERLGAQHVTFVLP